jgi:hypothetical protein
LVIPVGQRRSGRPLRWVQVDVEVGRRIKESN